MLAVEMVARARRSADDLADTFEPLCLGRPRRATRSHRCRHLSDDDFPPACPFFCFAPLPFPLAVMSAFRSLASSRLFATASCVPRWRSSPACAAAAHLG